MQKQNSRMRNWIVEYTVFPNTKYANSGMEKVVSAANPIAAVKKAKSKFIKVYAVRPM